jgi:hypothetical protein
MEMEVRAGDVFRPIAPGAHGWVIRTEPFATNAFVLAVSWPRLDDECVEDACILQPADHPDLRHPSTLADSMARVWDARRRHRGGMQRGLQQRDPLPPSLLARVLAGARAARRLCLKFKALLPPG